MPRTGALCAVAVGSAVLALAGAELSLVAWGYRYNPLHIEPQSTNDWRFQHAFKDDNFIYDPYLIWRPKAGFGIFNRQGYRGKELSIRKAADSFRVFALGDSNTLGWQGRGGPNWPEYLEELLTKEHPRVTVTNAGVWGYSSFQGFHRFTEVLRLEPDMILVSFGSNDTLTVSVSDATFAQRLQAARFADRTRLGQLGLAAWDRVSVRRAAAIPRVSLSEYVDNLRSIIQRARKQNVLIVLLTRPFSGSSPIGSWKQQAFKYNITTMRIGREENVPTVDVDGYFAGKEEFFADESHFTEEGHRRAAALIYRSVKPLLP
ncbi:MAG: SGNH/GDSL hydrolase family protein [Acidobacteria bacterium]|nr:SGNH/GDSL hydrolase family protein [Acidobacteriota bacterium]